MEGGTGGVARIHQILKKELDMGSLYWIFDKKYPEGNIQYKISGMDI